MSIFDVLLTDLDNVQRDVFAVDVTIDGNPVQGIFDEYSNEFEGVGTMIRTLEIPKSDLPSGIELDVSTLTLISDGRTFTIHWISQDGNQMVLDLT